MAGREPPSAPPEERTRACRLGRRAPTSPHRSPPGTSLGSTRPCRRQPIASSHVRGGATDGASRARGFRRPSNPRPEEAGSTRAIHALTRRPAFAARRRAPRRTWAIALRSSRGVRRIRTRPRSASTGPVRPTRRLAARANRAPPRRVGGRRSSASCGMPRLAVIANSTRERDGCGRAQTRFARSSASGDCLSVASIGHAQWRRRLRFLRDGTVLLGSVE